MIGAFLSAITAENHLSLNHAVSLRAVAPLIIAAGTLRNRDIMEGIEISYASPLMIRPNGRVRQRHAPGKYLFNLVARVGGEIRMGDQTHDPMAFVVPGKSRRKGQQIEHEKRREESSYQWS